MDHYSTSNLSGVLSNQIYDKSNDSSFFENTNNNFTDKRLQFKLNLLIFSDDLSKIVFILSLDGKCRQITNIDFKNFIINTYHKIFNSFIQIKNLMIDGFNKEEEMLVFIKSCMSHNNMSILVKETKIFFRKTKYYAIRVYQPLIKKHFHFVKLNSLFPKIECEMCLKNKLIMYIPVNSNNCNDLHKMYHYNEIKLFNFDLNAIDEINVAGLSNLGNTCYFNSGLQCIIHCKYLSNYFLKENFIKENKQGPLVQSFYQLLINLKQNLSYESPNTVLKEFRRKQTSYDDSAQHDSPEFVTDFLNSLSEELKRNNSSKKDNSQLPKDKTPESFEIKCKNKEDSIIKDLFYGHISNTYLCSCKKTVLFEEFLLFHCSLLKIESRKINCYYIIKFKKNKQKEYKLEDEAGLFKKNNNLDECFLVLYNQESNDFIILNDRELVMNIKKEENKTVLIFPQNNKKICFLIIPYYMEKNIIIHSKEDELGNNIFSSIDKKYLKDIKYICPFSISVDENENLKTLIKKIEKILEISTSTNSYSDIKLSSRFEKKKIIKIYVKLQKSEFCFNDNISKSRLIIQTKIDLDNEELSLNECLYLNKICPNYSLVCKKCQKRKELTLKIVKLPIYLIIMLKRGIIENGGFTKLKNEVKYPSVLNIFDYVDQEIIKDKSKCEYRLIAINGHSGNVNFGHYIAVINKNDQWYYISDSTVSKTSQFQIQNALLLFYQKVNI